MQRGKLNISVPERTAQNNVFLRPPHSSNVDSYRSVIHYKSRFREISRDSDVHNGSLKT